MNQLYRLGNYDTLSASLYWLNPKSVIKLTLSLNRFFKGKQRFFYNEYKKESGEINAYMDLEWWLSVNLFGSSQDGETKQFRVYKDSLYQFIAIIKTMKSWLTQDIGKDLFFKDANGKIHCNPKFQPLKLTNRYKEVFELSPGIHTNQLGTETIPGVMMFIDGALEAIFLNILDYLNFSLFIEFLNPYTMAMQMLTTFSAGVQSVQTPEPLQQSHIFLRKPLPEQQNSKNQSSSNQFPNQQEKFQNRFLTPEGKCIKKDD